ncbi:hypothetical protein D3C85_1091250 [compost metagenome]
MYMIKKKVYLFPIIMNHASSSPLQACWKEDEYKTTFIITFRITIAPFYLLDIAQKEPWGTAFYVAIRSSGSEIVT